MQPDKLPRHHTVPVIYFAFFSILCSFYFFGFVLVARGLGGRNPYLQSIAICYSKMSFGLMRVVVPQRLETRTHCKYCFYFSGTTAFFAVVGGWVGACVLRERRATNQGRKPGRGCLCWFASTRVYFGLYYFGLTWCCFLLKS